MRNREVLRVEKAEDAVVVVMVVFVVVAPALATAVTDNAVAVKGRLSS